MELLPVLRKQGNSPENIILDGYNKQGESNSGSREESEVAGFFVFSHIRMMGYFRLGKG